MAFQNVTSAGTFTVPNRVNSLLLQINNGWTGTIVLTAPNTIANTTRTIATITNPATGQGFRYWDMANGFTVVTTGATFGDLTVNWQGNRQAS